MERDISVNGIRVAIIKDIRRIADKVMGIKKGSVLIVSYDCIIPSKVKEYLESREVKIIRLS